MYSVTVPVPLGEENNGQYKKATFFLFLFGAILLCGGFLLSVFTLQSCPFESFSDCSGVLKASGPVLGVIGLLCILIARSKARFHTSQRQLQNEQICHLFLCRKNCQFVQFLIFGFLFLTSGMLISILGIWVPGCSPGGPNIQLNQTSSSDEDLQGCGFLSFQILGPLIVLTGLCFFVIAHVKKKQNLNLNEEPLGNEERTQSPESFQVTLGDAVLMFPPPPPPYFADPLSPAVTHCLMSSASPAPPPYHSVFSDGAQFADDQRTVAVRDEETIYTISGCSSPLVISPVQFFFSEPPPGYEEKASVESNEYSLSSSLSSSSVVTTDTSS
ncbi:transmembrane protein 171 isoform X1 [Tympanuchus pallidicinctus]|uniref:transmembrane protein 171 isoform X1 n=1 Tax=Tympanuchus pallidicinctus TaxID=109042 RepID=UPI0022870AE8|nr:transmembrane protein 171 isoform X1 [Tympanuchus pallidicinctus]